MHLQVRAVAFDNPIPGYNTTTTTNLRLWDAQAHKEFDLAAFNSGAYDKVGNRRVLTAAAHFLLSNRVS